MTLKIIHLSFEKKQHKYIPPTHSQICFKFVVYDEFNSRPAPLASTLVVLYCAWLFSGNQFAIPQKLAPKSPGTIINSELTSAGFTNEQVIQRLKAPHQFS